jgi:hypothetical protein
MSLSEKMLAMFEERQLEEIMRSWCLADKATRKHRLKTIIALAVELEEIKKVNIFSTLFGEMAIEAVIQGDWKELEEVVGYQTFKTESLDIQAKFAQLWEKFRLIAETAIAEERRRDGRASEAH